MSLFHSIKRLFGYGEDYDNEINGEDATVTLRKHAPLNEEEHQSEKEEKTDGQYNNEQVSVSIPFDVIFDHVIEVFNKSLPEFIASAVDKEAQRKYLYDTLDESVKQYVSDLSKQIAEATRKDWKNDKDKLLLQIKELTEKERRSEEKVTEAKNLQLSAERQKRAFAERVHDLENQLSKLEADREQLQLENRSLINKVKVNNVQESDFDALRDEITSLKQQLADAKAAAANSEELQIDNETISVLKQQIADMESDCEKLKAELLVAKTEAENLHGDNDKLKEENESIKAECELTKTECINTKNEIEAVKSENDTLTTKLLQYETKTGMADQMVTDLNQIAANAKQELADKKKECEEQREKLNEYIIENKTQADRLDRSEKTIKELEEKMALANEQLQSTQSELAEAQENLSVLNEIQQMVDQFETVKSKKDAKIAELNANIDSLNKKIESLQKTIEQNLEEHAHTEDALRQEIIKLKSNTTSDSAEEENVTTYDNQKAEESVVEEPDMQLPHISAIDESLDNTDWLSPFPSEEELKKSETQTNTTAKTSSPQKKSTINDNDTQLSLW